MVRLLPIWKSSSTRFIVELRLVLNRPWGRVMLTPSAVTKDRWTPPLSFPMLLNDGYVDVRAVALYTIVASFGRFSTVASVLTFSPMVSVVSPERFEMAVMVTTFGPITKEVTLGRFLMLVTVATLDPNVSEVSSG